MKPVYLLNAFSLQMVDPKNWEKVRLKEIDSLPPIDTLTSAIGHPDTAAVLGVKADRINVHLEPGDVAYVAQLTGGRLPEGCTTLPDNFKFVYGKVTVLP